MYLANVSIMLQWILSGWLAAITGLLLVRILSGSIILTGLFRADPEAPFGLDRLQLVFVTLFFGAGYAIFALTGSSEKGLPTISAPLLLILIGSNGTYLAGKYAALLGGKGRDR